MNGGFGTNFQRLVDPKYRVLRKIFFSVKVHIFRGSKPSSDFAHVECRFRSFVVSSKNLLTRSEIGSSSRFPRFIACFDDTKPLFGPRSEKFEGKTVDFALKGGFETQKNSFRETF